ncbi:MAG: segregation/condensation protein A [Halobacteriaceae archaeon]
MTSAPDAVPGTPGSDDEEVEPVELLVQLAEDGEIEPWDIDIVEVTDAFLARLDESDLRTSGRALFYASVLLRMKSDVIVAPEDPDEADEDQAEPAPWEAPLSEPGPPPGGGPVETLEAEIDRRLDRKSARGTPETLDELVRELREAERGSWWKSSRSYDTSDSPRGFRRGVQTVDYRSDDTERSDHEPTQQDVTETAHGEDIEALVAAVESALATRYDRGRSQVLFAEIQTVAGSRVETFLAVLFLAHRGVVRLEQDELFGDLYICDRSE